MPTYTCTENEFVENLRKISEHVKDITVHKKVETTLTGYMSAGDLPSYFGDTKLAKLVEKMDGRVDCVTVLNTAASFEGGYYFRLHVLSVQYSFTWGNITYVHNFEVRCKHEILEVPQFTESPSFSGTKRRILGKLVIKISEPDEKLAEISLPDTVQILAGRLVT